MRLGAHAGAVVVVAEVAVEVVDDAVRPPPRDRNGVDVDEADSGDDRRDAEQRHGQPAQVYTRDEERTAEEVRPDGHDVVAQCERDCLVTGGAVERRLRNQRVQNCQRGEGERKDVRDTGIERKPPRACGVGADTDERDGEQDLLPRSDRRQRRAPDPGRIERRHHGVVHREPGDEDVEGGERAAPDQRAGRDQEQRIESELNDRHAPRVQRAGTCVPARRAFSLPRAPGLAAEHEPEGCEDGDDQDDADVRGAEHCPSLVGSPSVEGLVHSAMEQARCPLSSGSG